MLDLDKFIEYTAEKLTDWAIELRYFRFIRGDLGHAIDLDSLAGAVSGNNRSVSCDVGGRGKTLMT